MVIGAISIIISGQTTEPAPAPHPIISLPRLRVQKFIIILRIVPIITTKSMTIKVKRLPFNVKGPAVKAPMVAPSGAIEVTIELNKFLLSTTFTLFCFCCKVVW